MERKGPKKPGRLPTGTPRGIVEDAELFKDVMSRFPTGVTIVTGKDVSGAPVGFTANAVASVSLSPRLILVCADKASESLAVLLRTRSFAVSVLRAEDEEIAIRFSADVPDNRFLDLELRPTEGGPPVLERALAWMSCRVWKEFEAGDHVVLIGAVVDAGLGPEGQPLVFFRRAYGTIDATPRA